MEEGVVRSRFGHFRSFLEVCVAVFVTHVVPFFDKSHFLIPVASFSSFSPSSEAHIGLFGGKKKVSEQEFRRPHHNHLTSINAEIDHRDNRSVLIAQRISNI